MLDTGKKQVDTKRLLRLSLVSSGTLVMWCGIASAGPQLLLGRKLNTAIGRVIGGAFATLGSVTQLCLRNLVPPAPQLPKSLRH